jgi:hypothetical protein
MRAERKTNLARAESDFVIAEQLCKEELAEKEIYDDEQELAEEANEDAAYSVMAAEIKSTVSDCKSLRNVWKKARVKGRAVNGGLRLSVKLPRLDDVSLSIDADKKRVSVRAVATSPAELAEKHAISLPKFARKPIEFKCDLTFRPDE